METKSDQLLNFLGSDDRTPADDERTTSFAYTATWNDGTVAVFLAGDINHFTASDDTDWIEASAVIEGVWTLTLLARYSDLRQLRLVDGQQAAVPRSGEDDGALVDADEARQPADLTAAADAAS